MRVLFFLWVVQGFAAFNLTWGTPAVTLDAAPPVGDADSNAVIALDPMGNGVAIWGRTTGKGATEDIWADRYDHSMRVWSGPVKISGGGNAMNGRVAIDHRGHAIFVWDEGFPTQIMCRTLSAEGIWSPSLSSPPDQIYSSNYAQINPQIKLDSAGNGVVVWMEHRKGSYQIHSAKKLFQMPWDYLGRISEAKRDAHLSPTKTMGMNGSGEAIAVWHEMVDRNSEIWGARYSEGGWLASFPISGGKRADSPAVGIDEAGDCVVVWQEDNKIQSKTIKNGVLSEAITASDPAHKAIHPDLSLDATGNSVLVYERHNSLHKFIAGTTLAKGSSSWTRPSDISAPSPIDVPAAGYPVLALNEIGDGVVIWKEFNGTNIVIQGAGYSLGTWSFIKTLSSSNDNSGSPIPGYDVSVAVNLAGNTIAVWPEDPSLAGSFQLKANAAIFSQLEETALANTSPPSPTTNPETGSKELRHSLIKANIFLRLKATVGTGLANAAPQPPAAKPETVIAGIASGKQIVHRFPAHTDLINILTWSCSNEAVLYRIYRNNLSSFIGTSVKPYFEDHQREPKKQEIYLITAVDQHGQESAPMTLVVQPR